MKRTLLTLLVALVVSGAYAQVGAGIKAGANFPNQDIQNLDTESKTGYHFGAFFDISVSDNIGIQPEILFSKEGTKFDDITGTARSIDYSYLTVPVLLKLKLLKVLNLHAGPQFNILANSETDYEDWKGSIENDLKGMNFAVAFGAGVELPFGLMGGVRYVTAVSDLNDNFQINGTTVEIKNKTLQVYLGLKLF